MGIPQDWDCRATHKTEWSPEDWEGVQNVFVDSEQTPFKCATGDPECLHDVRLVCNEEDDPCGKYAVATAAQVLHFAITRKKPLQKFKTVLHGMPELYRRFKIMFSCDLIPKWPPPHAFTGLVNGEDHAQVLVNKIHEHIAGRGLMINIRLWFRTALWIFVARYTRFVTGNTSFTSVCPGFTPETEPNYLCLLHLFERCVRNVDDMVLVLRTCVARHVMRSDEPWVDHDQFQQFVQAAKNFERRAALHDVREIYLDENEVREEDESFELLCRTAVRNLLHLTMTPAEAEGQ